MTLDYNPPPLVTIIITIKDRFEWFRDCLDSVLELEYPHIEIIIVDDGSSSPVASFIASEYGDIENILIIRNEETLGPGASREIGRRKASGQFINYLDSDDILHPRKILTQVNYLIDHPEIGMCYCEAIEFTESPITGQEPKWYPNDHRSSGKMPLTLIKRPWGTCSCLWTKNVTDKIGPWAPLWIGEDVEYEFRGRCQGITIAFIDEVLCYIRRSDSKFQLSHESAWRNIQYTYFLIAMAHNTSKFKNSLESTVKLIVVEKIVNYAIYLLKCNQKSLAIESLQTLGPIMGKNILKRVSYSIFIMIVSMFPSNIAIKIIRRTRKKIPEFIKSSI